MHGRQLDFADFMGALDDRVRSDAPNMMQRTAEPRAPGKRSRSMSADEVRARALAYVAHVCSYQRAHKRPPTRRELAAWWGVSPSTVHKAACDAERLRLVEHLWEAPGRRRSRGIIAR